MIRDDLLLRTTARPVVEPPGRRIQQRIICGLDAKALCGALLDARPILIGQKFLVLQFPRPLEWCRGSKIPDALEVRGAHPACAATPVRPESARRS